MLVHFTRHFIDTINHCSQTQKKTNVWKWQNEKTFDEAFSMNSKCAAGWSSERFENNAAIGKMCIQGVLFHFFFAQKAFHFIITDWIDGIDVRTIKAFAKYHLRLAIANHAIFGTLELIATSHQFSCQNSHVWSTFETVDQSFLPGSFAFVGDRIENLLNIRSIIIMARGVVVVDTERGAKTSIEIAKSTFQQIDF